MLQIPSRLRPVLLTALVCGLTFLFRTHTQLTLEIVQLQTAETPVLEEDYTFPERGTREDLPLCLLLPPSLVGLITVNKTEPSSVQYLERLHPELERGGRWAPRDCKARSRLAVVVPYRNRETNLKFFLQHMHPFLQRQLIEYQIFIAEQSEHTRFNRGMMRNIGFIEANKLGEFDCTVFHDLDLLPENDNNLYHCSKQPRHLCVAIDTFNYRVLYRAAYFGGAVLLNNNQFQEANGYSNYYVEWGGEDIDLMYRVCHSGYHVERYEGFIGRYQECMHAKDRDMKQGIINLANSWLLRKDIDGLNDLTYKVNFVRKRRTHTLINVDIEPAVLKAKINDFRDDLKYAQTMESGATSNELRELYRNQQARQKAKLLNNLVVLRETARKAGYPGMNVRLLNTTLEILKKPMPQLGSV